MAKIRKSSRRDRQLVLYFLASKVYISKEYKDLVREVYKRDKYGICYLKTIRNEDKQKRDRFN